MKYILVTHVEIDVKPENVYHEKSLEIIVEETRRIRQFNSVDFFLALLIFGFLSIRKAP